MVGHPGPHGVSVWVHVGYRVSSGPFAAQIIPPSTAMADSVVVFTGKPDGENTLTLTLTTYIYTVSY